MPRALSLLVLALLGAALAAPGPALGAEEFKFTVLRNVCQTSGGEFGQGRLLLKVRVEELGSTGANKFTLDAHVSHRRHGGTRWQTEFNWDRFRVTFPDDADSYFHERWFRYHPNDNGVHRIVVVIRVWHNRNVLAKKTITGRAC